MSLQPPRPRYGWSATSIVTDSKGLKIGDRVRHISKGSIGTIVGMADNSPLPPSEIITWLVDFDHGGTGYNQATFSIELLPD